ncbi:hypothetical protein METBIDRAFT_146454 [Metschnikowia bicuspidata var. bicuspidata NRRL YB-4993]|uniref:Uncharacterized protein n=1 Tax=Metschnikowia bicuspidata var. bicuspidata NRRL YB-4993 TaxID=869754 RepID=A0A1A0HDV2_9ASCO|nr:hypothetical protein METBIDRAFT_146454 [Metschnikowia bicuspidata var. bicuspidata NRRL YB-4993]OBA22103.1 hypothetical protein METBIDRAFT_146454 [Metschnikowia bicuspidata var. bicuspidata NRRL YB-4993]
MAEATNRVLGSAAGLSAPSALDQCGQREKAPGYWPRAPQAPLTRAAQTGPRGPGSNHRARSGVPVCHVPCGVSAWFPPGFHRHVMPIWLPIPREDGGREVQGWLCLCSFSTCFYTWSKTRCYMGWAARGARKASSRATTPNPCQSQGHETRPSRHVQQRAFPTIQKQNQEEKEDQTIKDKGIEEDRGRN